MHYKKAQLSGGKGQRSGHRESMSGRFSMDTVLVFASIVQSYNYQSHALAYVKKIMMARQVRDLHLGTELMMLEKVND